MNKLFDYLRNIKYDIGLGCFTKTNLPHIQPETLKLLVNVPMSSEKDYHDKFVSNIISELSQSVVNTILTYIFNNGKKSFIDLTNRFGISTTQFKNPYSRSREIISKLDYDIPQKYLITGSRISSEYFIDSSSFYLPFNSKIDISNNSLMYPIGSITLGTKREVWVDPFMRWDDNYVLCFDDIRIDVSNFLVSVQNEPTNFPAKILVTLDLRYKVINPEVFFIYEDHYIKNWDIQSIVKQENRNKKIDDLLNGEYDF